VRYARDVLLEEVEVFCRENINVSVEDCLIGMVLIRLNLEDCALYSHVWVLENKLEPEDREEPGLFSIPGYSSRDS
jgi:hypothetical protein